MAKYGSSGKSCGDDIKQREISNRGSLVKGGGFEAKGYELGTAGGYSASGQVSGCAKPNYTPPDAKASGTAKSWSPKDPNVGK